MSSIWSDDARYNIWLKIEILACEAWGKEGRIPKAALKEIQEKSRFDIARIQEIEAEVKHDVIAFVSAVSENVGPSGRYLHLGMTSSDVLDTALAVQLKNASDILLEDLKKVLAALKTLAEKHKMTPMIGRSHGIHAEPITFGLKMALFFAEFSRHVERLKRARETISVGMISGAVGTFAHIPPSIEEYVCRELDLKPASISTQVIQRDRHAEFFTTLALIASSVEKLAVEIRHLQRTEVLEAEEPFSKSQKGSSAMPHKRNPILSENITGLARIVRSNSIAAMENVALWHERDISHSSVERVIAPDSTIALDFMLDRLVKILEGLNVYPENMRANLEKTKGLIFSQRVLLKLVDAGMVRDEAYRLVQNHAMRSWRGEGDFRELVSADPAVTKFLKDKDLNELFDINFHFKHVDKIFKRVF